MQTLCCTQEIQGPNRAPLPLKNGTKNTDFQAITVELCSSPLGSLKRQTPSHFPVDFPPFISSLSGPITCFQSNAAVIALHRTKSTLRPISNVFIKHD